VEGETTQEYWDDGDGYEYNKYEDEEEEYT